MTAHDAGDPKNALPEALTAAALAPAFWPPARVGVASSWWGHVPFAHWLTAALRPDLVVDFASNNAVSFAAFCEALRRADIAGRCRLVDAWAGADQAFLECEQFAERRYGDMAALTRATLPEAAALLPDGAIDLVHFEAQGAGETLATDLAALRPKLSERAVALFHNIEAVAAAEFWADLRTSRPSFAFSHSGGLGVAAIGPRVPQAILDLTSLSPQAAQILRERLAELGARWEAADQGARRARALAEAEGRRVAANDKAVQLILTDREAFLEWQLGRERAWNIGVGQREKTLQSEISAIYSSRSWRLANMASSARAGWRSPSKALQSAVTLLRRPGLRRDVQAIAGSGLFDESFYSGAEEARAMGLTPIEHYLKKGEAAGLAPSPLFDPAFYLETYPDLRGVAGSPLVHYIAFGRHEGRRGYSLVNALRFPTGGIAPDRETMVVAIHEANRTGAPILGWNIIAHLQKRYNVIALLRKGGAIEQAFADVSSGAVVLPEGMSAEPAEMEALAEKIVKLYKPKYLVANSIETRSFILPFERAGVPTVALIVEFCSNVRPAGTLQPIFEHASKIMFEAQIVAESALADYPFFEPRRYAVMPQGSSRLPPSNAGGADQQTSKDDFSALPAADGSLFVVGMGTINPRKGVDVFIAAAASMRRRRPSLAIKFAWVGRGYRYEQEYLDYLNEQIKRSGLGPSFVFLGEFEDLAPIYARADIFFVSSRLDALPNVAIDAALHGIPTICFDQAGGLAEIFKTSPEAKELVVPYLDAEAAAELMLALADDPARRTALSRTMRAIAAESFDMARFVETIDRLGGEAALETAQSARDFAFIRQSGAFNARLYLSAFAPPTSADDALSRYLHASRLVAPRGRPLTHLFVRRPMEGFHPLAYAAENADYDETAGQDPFAHYIASGFPTGPWKHQVIKPGTAEPPHKTSLKVAAHGHFYYPELLEDFVARLRGNRTSVDLFLTTTSKERAKTLEEIASRLGVAGAAITIVPNRGRDIGPLLTGIPYEALAAYDVVGHFHGKRTAHMDAAIGETWRNFLWEHLIGGAHPMTDIVMEAFAADPKLGLVFPEDPHLNDWNEDRAIAEDLARRIGLVSALPVHFDFPNGTMFWARPQALKPLMDLNLSWSDYPEEPLPMDGTLLHALERFLPFSAKRAGLRYATTYVKDSVR